MDAEIYKRMETLVRGMVEAGPLSSRQDRLWEKAREILDALPDPDEITARAIMADWYAERGYGSLAAEVRKGGNLAIGVDVTDALALAVRYVRAGRASK